MEDVRGHTFIAETVDLDNKNFIDCSFLSCELRYCGGATTFLRTGFVSCRWSFGGAALRTLNMMECFGIKLQTEDALSDCYI